MISRKAGDVGQGFTRPAALRATSFLSHRVTLILVCVCSVGLKLRSVPNVAWASTTAAHARKEHCSKVKRLVQTCTCLYNFYGHMFVGEHTPRIPLGLHQIDLGSIVGR